MVSTPCATPSVVWIVAPPYAEVEDRQAVDRFAGVRLDDLRAGHKLIGHC